MQLLEFVRDFYVPSRLDLKPKSAEQLIVAVRLMDRAHGSPVVCADLSAAALTVYLRWLSESGRAPKTINGKRTSILTVWRAAYRAGHAPRPCDWEDVPPLRQARRLPTAWSAEQVRRIIEACRLQRGRLWCGLPRALWWESFVRCLYETGARLSAMLAVQVADVDLIGCTITLRAETAKSGIEQSVRISARSAELIEQIAEVTTFKEVWPWGRDRNELWRAYRRILKQAGLPHGRRDLFHKLRRTTATLTARAASVEIAQHQLGHKSPQTTLQSYIDPTFLHRIQSVDVLPSLD